MTIPLWFILYIGLGFSVYFPCLKGTVIYDDRYTVALKAAWLGSWKTIPRAMSRWLSWYVIWGLRQWPGTLRGFHCWNVWVHLAGACLVRSFTGSTLAGALFVVHPWAVNAVGSMAAGGALLSALLGVSGFGLILHGHPLYAALFLVLACLTKEDAVGFGLAYALACPWFWLGLLLLPLGLKLKNWYLHPIRMDGKQAFESSTDSEMRRGGMPESYGWEDHIWTVLIQTAICYPLWAFGMNQSPYHGSAFPKPNLGQKVVGVVFTGIALVLMLGFPALRMPLSLLMTGPFLTYLAVRVHEQIAEYRNYSSLFGLVWLFSLIPYFDWFAVPLILFFGSQTYWKSFAWSSASMMWTCSALTSSGDRSRAFSELSALNMGMEGKPDWEKSESYARQALALNPQMASARKNLAWTLICSGRKDEGIREMEEVCRRNPEYHFAHDELGDIYRGEGRMIEALKSYEEAIRLAGPRRAYRAAAALNIQPEKW